MPIGFMAMTPGQRRYRQLTDPSDDSLRKTGIFADVAGDFPQLVPQDLGVRRRGRIAKNRDFRPNLAFPREPSRGRVPFLREG
jgi:ABC-type phosphonate transport system ATPase subunit